MAGYSDAANFFATSALVAVEAARRAANPEIAEFGDVFQVGGTSTPFQDPCDGLLYSRVATVYPTAGDGAAFTQVRNDFSLPAWAFAVEVGIMHCRSNIDEDGAAVDPDLEAEYAERDGRYRMVLLDGLSAYFPDEIREAALGLSLSPWAPIGPDGGVSGGLVVVTVISGRLCVPIP